MNQDLEYNLSAKRKDTEKWWTFGGLRKNKWDKLQVSFRVTPEFLEYMKSFQEGDWINFSVFEKEDGKQPYKGEEKPRENDEIPF